MAMIRTLTGRTVIYTDVDVIDRSNVVEVLNKALETHDVNKNDIQYLYDYYKGKQPILERVKDIRPEINNKLVENRANEIVSFKVGYLMGEPIQYVCRGGSDEHSEAINQLNEFVFAEDKAAKDKELADWFTIAVLLSVWYSRMPLTMMLTKLLLRFTHSTLDIPLWSIIMVSATSARWV